VHREYIEAIWKEVFQEVIFSTNIIETPKSSRDRAVKERERERKKKEKLQKSLQIKGKLTFWEHKYTSTSKILFNVIPFPPSIIPFQKPFSKSLRKFS
jgi:hypothetical protein